MRLAKRLAIALPQNQIPCRRGCSEVRYQRDVRRLNPGEIPASAIPKMKRTTMRPVQFLVAAVQASMTDHPILEYNDMGQSRLSSRYLKKGGILTIK